MAREDLNRSREGLDTTESGREFHRQTHLMLKKLPPDIKFTSGMRYLELMASGFKVVDRTRENFIRG